MTVSSMDKTVTVPGIASILRAMVMGSPVSGTRVTQEKATVEKLGGKGLAALGNVESAAPQPEAAATPISTGSISIMADPRVNAVLVSDAAYRMPYYAQVIKDLDKPVELAGNSRRHRGHRHGLQAGTRHSLSGRGQQQRRMERRRHHFRFRHGRHRRMPSPASSTARA